jgi:guanylate kinase
MKMSQRKNNIFIISAPSGAGKSTLIHLLLAQIPSLFFSVSHTTRAPRPGEREGIDYFFIAQASFEEMIRSNQFLEWAKVHGSYYGTSRNMLERSANEGKDLILDIDVQGAAQVRKELPDAVSVFILPPSYEVLRARLMQRQKDSVEQVEKRLITARKEIEHWREYEYIVINEELNEAFESLSSLVRGERLRRDNLENRIENILKSFII